MSAVVGITSYVEGARWGVWEVPAALVPLTYVRAIERAHAMPILIPPSEHSPDALERLDALVLAGGADIDPQLYGATPHPETGPTRPDRDGSEVALLADALRRDLPVLGICRGMQLLNVATGGDLVQHLDGNRLRMHLETPGVFGRHEVTMAEDSRLGAIVGARAEVPSHHHQAPGRLGAGVRAVAWAPDGTVEGIEMPDRSFAVGVLWHPEEGDDGSLFEALVGAVEGRSQTEDVYSSAEG